MHKTDYFLSENGSDSLFPAQLYQNCCHFSRISFSVRKGIQPKYIQYPSNSPSVCMVSFKHSNAVVHSYSRYCISVTSVGWWV